MDNIYSLKFNFKDNELYTGSFISWIMLFNWNHYLVLRIYGIVILHQFASSVYLTKYHAISFIKIPTVFSKFWIKYCVKCFEYNFDDKNIIVSQTCIIYQQTIREKFVTGFLNCNIHKINI